MKYLVNPETDRIITIPLFAVPSGRVFVISKPLVRRFDPCYCHIRAPFENMVLKFFTTPLPLLNLKLWESRMVLKAVKWE